MRSNRVVPFNELIYRIEELYLALEYVEELLSNEVEADKLLTNKPSFSQQLMDALKQARTEGKIPLVISSSKSPVELIREGRETD